LVEDIESSDIRLLVCLLCVRFNIDFVGDLVFPKFTRGSDGERRIGVTLPVLLIGAIIFGDLTFGDLTGAVFTFGDFTFGDLTGVAFGILGLLRIVYNGVFISFIGLSSGVGDRTEYRFFGVGDRFFGVFSLFNNNKDIPEIIVIPLNINTFSIFDIYYYYKKITFYRSSATYFSFNSSGNSSYSIFS
jgi:hypothetical protein